MRAVCTGNMLPISSNPVPFIIHHASLFLSTCPSIFLLLLFLHLLCNQSINPERAIIYVILFYSVIMIEWHVLLSITSRQKHCHRKKPRSILSGIVAVVYLSQFQPYMLRVLLHQRRNVISNGKERIYDVGVGFGDGEC